MKLPAWYTLHRWTAVAALGFLVVWILSGVVLMLPPVETKPRTSERSVSPPPYEDLEVSPAGAVDAALPDDESRHPARSVRLRSVGSRYVFRIVDGEGEVHLVDAVTGEPLEITEEMAVELARSAYPDADLASVERLASHELAYPFGPLPVYRIAFEDARGTLAYVSGVDGRLSWSTRLSRMRTGITSLHDFSLLAPLVRGGRYLQLGLMLLGSAAASLVVGTGLYLQIRRWQRVP